MNWREHLSASAQTLFIQQGDELRLLPRQLKIPAKILCFCITRWIKRGLELVLVPPILDLLAACTNGEQRGVRACRRPPASRRSVPSASISSLLQL